MSALNPPLLPGVALQLIGTVLQGPPGVRGRDGLSAYEVWKMNGNPTGTVADYLLSLKGTTGDNGKNIELQKSASHIQWRLEGDTTWINLIPLVDVKGADGTNGRGVVNITRSAGTGVPGTIDTYTITYTDATTSTFNVYNGADGNGDMSKATYDTNNNGKVDTAEVADAVPWAGITDKPTLGTASALNAPAAGNAATSEVVKGDDTRLSDARTPTTHTHGTGDVTGLNTALTTLSDHLSAPSNAHPASAVANTPAGNISATTVQAAINELDAEKFAKSGDDIAGNLGFTGTARRIRFPYVALPVINRALFQSSDENSPTYIGAIPSGTAKSSGFTFSNSSDPDNAGYGHLIVNDTEMVLSSATALGTGGTGGAPGAVPLRILARDAGLKIGDGGVLVISGVLGYGPNTGGAATQVSKGAGVALNKPTGTIYMAASTFAIGEIITFPVTCSYSTATSVISAMFVGGVGANGRYQVWCDYGGDGIFVVCVRNISGASFTEAPVIQYNINAGSSS